MNDHLTPFDRVIIGAQVESAPWLDNLLLCYRSPSAFAATGGG